MFRRLLAAAHAVVNAHEVSMGVSESGDLHEALLLMSSGDGFTA